MCEQKGQDIYSGLGGFGWVGDYFSGGKEEKKKEEAHYCGSDLTKRE